MTRRKKSAARHCTECGCRLSIYNERTACFPCRQRLRHNGNHVPFIPAPLSGGQTAKIFKKKKKGGSSAARGAGV